MNRIGSHDDGCRFGRGVCCTRRREEEKEEYLNRDGSYEVDKGERDTSTATGGEVPIMREMIQGLPFLRQLWKASWFGYKRAEGRQASKQAAGTSQDSHHGWDMSGGYTCGGRISDRTGCTDRSVGLRHEGVCTIKQEELSESRLEGSILAVSAAFVPASPGGVEDHLVVVVQVVVQSSAVRSLEMAAFGRSCDEYIIMT